jgi:hypothetical protein
MPKTISVEEAKKEIEDIQKRLEEYKYGSSSLSEDFSYPKLIKRLQFLRNSLVRRKSTTTKQ